MRFGPSLPFQPWESEHGKRHNFLGFVGDAAAAYLQYRANQESWEYAKDIPKLQAEANKIVIKKQKEDYDEITDDMRSRLQNAINEYASQIDQIIFSDSFENAFPDVPDPAEYVPVDVCCVQGSTIECNISHTTRADEWVRQVNRLHEQNDLLHLLSMCPDFLVNLDIMNKSIQNLMRGILPVGDVVEVLNDNAEQASLSGRIGSTRKTTARDLGISKLRAQAAGRREMREHGSWLNSAVSPQQRQLNIKDMMLAPQDRVNYALAQAQLIQNSLQNKNNALAQKEPYKMARIQMRLQKQITLHLPAKHQTCVQYPSAKSQTCLPPCRSVVDFPEQIAGSHPGAGPWRFPDCASRRGPVPAGSACWQCRDRSEWHGPRLIRSADCLLGESARGSC